MTRLTNTPSRRMPPTGLSHRPDTRQHAAAALALTSGLVGLLSSCGGGVPSQSASQVLSNAVGAARNAGSFHFVDKVGSGSQAVVLTGDTGTGTAQETSTSPAGRLAVSLVDGVAFLQAGAATLENFLGLSTTLATKESGKWVSVAKGEKGYAKIVQSLAPDAELDAYIPQIGVGTGKRRTLHGIAVLPVSGAAPAKDSSAGLPAVATLFVSVQAPNLPVGGAISGNDIHGRRQSEEVVFTKWGEQLRLSAPPGAVSLASLTG